MASPDKNSDAKVDAAVVAVSFDSSTKLLVGDAAHLGANGSVALKASSTLNSIAIADGNVANTAGAAVAVSVVTGNTTASVEGGAIVGKTVFIIAESERIVTTTARSSPGGAAASADGNNKSEAALSDSKAATSSGKIKLAGAIAVGTDTGTTSAFVNNAVINAGSGVFDVASSSADSVVVKADGSSTDTAAKGVGIAVAVSITDRTNLAYLSGKTDVTASEISVRAFAPRLSSFDVTANSGAGGGSSATIAGALAINISLFRHSAYIDEGAVITSHGLPSMKLSAVSNVSSTTKATASNSGGNAAKQGIGASVALGYEESVTSAYVGDNATTTGGQSLTLSADSSRAMNTMAEGGAKGGSTETPVVAISVSRNDARATLGIGGALALSGDLLVKLYAIQLQLRRLAIQTLLKPA